jgi:hypothetical protein
MKLNRSKGRGRYTAVVRARAQRKAQTTRAAERVAELEHESDTTEFRKLRDRLKRDMSGDRYATS